MKKVYFIILSTIIIGFVVGVMFELDRKNSTPIELIEKIPKFMENVFSPTTTTMKSKKDDIPKLIVQRQKMISEIEQNLERIKSIKDKKQKKELCKKVFNIRKIIKQMNENINAKDSRFIKSNKKEFRKMINKIRRYCYFVQNVKNVHDIKK